jgi:hypothetical protein
VDRVRTKRWETTRDEFASMWARVRHPARGATAAGLREAVFALVPPRPSCPRGDDDLLRLEMAAEILAARSGGRPVPLGCRFAADLLGISKSQAARLIRRLVAAGVFQPAREHDRAAGLAAEYLFAPGQVVLAKPEGPHTDHLAS